MQRIGEEHDSIRALRRFLNAETAGCEFVGHFVVRGEGITWLLFEGVPGAPAAAHALSDLVAQAAAENELAGIVFPEVSGLDQLKVLVDALADSPLWRVEREPGHQRGVDVDIVRVGWINSACEVCSALGMAPVLTMPPTRRAPYLSLFVWPGPRTNAFRSQPFPDIGIGDMQPPPGLDRNSYTAMRQRTERNAQRINGGSLPVRATFILPR